MQIKVVITMASFY